MASDDLRTQPTAAAGRPPARPASRLRRRLAHPLFPVTARHVTDRDALYAAYQFCAAEGGPGPGPDRVSYADLSPGEVGDLVAVLSDALTNRWYRADPDRFAGLGFVLGDGWCGVDLDDVRHPDGGVRAWAATLPTCRPLPPAGTLGPDRWFSRRTPRS